MTTEAKQKRNTLKVLSNITTALEDTMKYYGSFMPQKEQAKRRQYIENARAIVPKPER